MALSLGYCDWLVLLLLWGWFAEFDRCPSPAAGYCTRWHCTLSTGLTVWLKQQTLILSVSSLTCLNVHTWLHLLVGVWSRESQWGTNLGSPADCWDLWDRHPHRFPGRCGAHPVNVSIWKKYYAISFHKSSSADQVCDPPSIQLLTVDHKVEIYYLKSDQNFWIAVFPPQQVFPHVLPFCESCLCCSDPAANA